jgi:SAM-dependent methyltransferase
VTGDRSEGASSEGYDRARYNPSLRKIWPWPTVLLERAAGWIRGLPGQVWLDAACGEGHLGALLAGERTLIGLDLDPIRLRRALPRSYRLLLQGSVSSIPVRDEAVAGIASIETLEHVADLDWAIREFARCLSPNGHVIVTVPSVTLRSWWEMRRTGRPVYCDAQEHVREFSSVPITGFSHKFETWKEFEGRWRRHGLAVVRTDGVGILFPMCHGPLSWAERLMTQLYRESWNRWLGRLPFLRRFPYYRMYLLQKRASS